eukprot:TRINITY_DN16189_c0_g1_i1.p3 TRINITY_DN16189_c0_g1~~TRINITY_DN16189_c0_g1_i1.p3  ORF type:complete len:233 (-),score=36.75 TRINITY_DN16189_c0_g1_i1:59-757(-)
MINNAEMDVQAQDLADRCGLLTVAGPDSGNLMEELQVNLNLQEWRTVQFQDAPVIVAHSRPNSYDFIADERISGELWRVIALKGTIPMGSEAYERVRVCIEDRPAPCREFGTLKCKPINLDINTTMMVNVENNQLQQIKSTTIGQQLDDNCKFVKLSPKDESNSEVLLNDKIFSLANDEIGFVTSVAQDIDGRMKVLGYLQKDMQGIENVNINNKQFAVQKPKYVVYGFDID